MTLSLTLVSQMSAWRDEGLSLHVSVNISAYQLQSDAFIDSLKTILSVYPDIEPSWLELEILETSALEDISLTSHIIQSCKEVGVKIALDDFGTGYSSLTYLRRLAIDTLKIDKSFVIDMLQESDDLCILEGIIGLSKAFNHSVIAEGVESEEHGKVLLQLGCQLAQGYYIARPMSHAKIVPWLQTWTPDASWKEQKILEKEDIALLFIITKHRAWMHNIKQFLNQNSEETGSMNAHLCLLGKWLEYEGKENYANHPLFENLCLLHEEVHNLGIKVIESSRLQNKDISAQYLYKMEYTSQKIQDTLHLLMH